LLGKIEEEYHDIAHLIPCTHMTDSCINAHKSLDRLIQEKNNLGLSNERTISSSLGILLSTQIINDVIIDILQELNEENSPMFPTNIGLKDYLE